MELNYENFIPTQQGYEYEFANTVSQVRYRVRIKADKSYPEQSFAIGEVWLTQVGWVECATLLKGSWIGWGKASPTQDADCKQSVLEASHELVARIAATLNF